MFWYLHGMIGYNGAINNSCFKLMYVIDDRPRLQ